jgi:hypothetical protein
VAYLPAPRSGGNSRADVMRCCRGSCRIPPELQARSHHAGITCRSFFRFWHWGMAGARLHLAGWGLADRSGHTIYIDFHSADESQFARLCAKPSFGFSFATAAALGTPARSPNRGESGGIWTLSIRDSIGPRNMMRRAPFFAESIERAKGIPHLVLRQVILPSSHEPDLIPSTQSTTI